MGLKGSGPFFQRSMANSVLQGYVTRICEIYIDDVLLFGTTDDEYIDNTRKVLARLRAGHVTANPEKTELGLDEVEYVGHLISSTGISFTEEKRLQVLDFPPARDREGATTIHRTRELFSRSCSSHDGDGPTSTEAY